MNKCYFCGGFITIILLLALLLIFPETSMSSPPGYSSCVRPLQRPTIPPSVVTSPTVLPQNVGGSQYVTPFVTSHGSHYDFPYVTPVVVQQALAPAFVFQVLNPFNPVPYQGLVNPMQGAPIQAPIQQSSQVGTLPQGGQQPAPSEDNLDRLVDRITQRVIDRLANPHEQELPNVEGSTPNIPNSRSALAPNGNNGANGNGNNTSQVLGVLHTMCANCHSNGSAKGGVILFDGNNFSPRRSDGSSLAKQTLLQVMSEGRMPPAAVTDQSKRVPLEIIKQLESILR